MPALATALALLAMTFVPAVAAHAAPGDLAHGVVSVDANKNGALDAGGPAGEADRGLAGVVVNALDAGGNVVGTTTTAADGSWSILEADVTGAAVSIEIVTSGANGDVYATYPAASGDNDFARNGAPNTATAALTGTDVELNALVFPVWKLDAKLADDPDGVGGKSILTGTPTWDAGSTEPGQDDSASNTKVRSADVVAFNWSLTAESEDGSLGDAFAEAIFEQTITLNGGAVANFASIPAVCDQVKSSIVAQPSGTAIAAKATPPAGTTSVTLSCVLGEMGVDPAPSAYILSTQVQPSSLSPNGSSFDTSSRFYAADANGAATAQPAAGPTVPPIEVTAAPRYDVEKIPGGMTWGQSTIDGVLTAGYFAYYTVQISTDRKVGVEGFAQPITLEESFWANRSVAGPNGEPVGSSVDDLKWYLTDCIPSPGINSGGQIAATLVYGKTGVGPLSTAANSVRDSGTCSTERTGAADTGNYTLTFNGIDTSGLTYPTQTAGGQSLAAGPYYVASYRLQVFLPLTELDRAQGDPADGVGELSIGNRVGDFDPAGVSGASNFGSGVEPGYCDPGPGSDQATNCDQMEDGKRSNNVAGPATLRVAPGNFGKYLLDNRTAWTYSSAISIPNQTSTHTGDGQVQPGQAFSSVVHLNNTALAWADVQLCDVFDSTMLKLVPLDSDATITGTWGAGVYSAMTRTGATAAANQADQGNWIVKYGTIDLTGDDPNNGTLDVATNRYEGDWSKQREATNGPNTACGSPSINWSDTPTDATNVVWVRTVPGYSVEGGTGLRWFLAFEQRDTYNGGPHAGEQIPSGTVAANFANVKTPSWNANWNPATYIPGAGNTTGTHQTGESAGTQGDRWTVTRAIMSIQKRTIAETVNGESSSGVSDYGATGVTVAGKPVVWQIMPTLTAHSDPAAPVNDVVIADTLPEYVVYDEAGTAALAAAGGFPMPTSVTPNGDGTTTLVWNLGTRTPNAPSPSDPANHNGGLPILKIATYTDSMAPPNTSAVNWTEITASGLVPVSAHKDDHTIRIEQSGQVQLKKSVDKTLDLQDDDQVYALQVKNFSETLPIQAPTVYDVLPYNGDATNPANVNRTPASDYAGTNLLNAAPQAFEFDGTTTRAGTFHYTTVPGADVPQRQQDDTDASIWSTTFTPNATGFKFVAATPLTTTANPSASGIKIVFQTDQNGNHAGDLYTNRFTAISPTLNGGNQLLTSNTVSVRVVGFSLGDFVWFDLNGNGTYEAGTDRPAPEGVTVQVRSADGTVVATTATLGGAQQGRWAVNNLPAGDYYVTIPASQFAASGPLAGAVAASGAVLDPNVDANEDADHHAIADGTGVRSAGLITLSADTAADPISGDEPLGDNVAGLTLAPLTTDDFTNLTLDLALVPGAKFTVSKVVDGEAAQYAAGAEFTIEVSCVFDGRAVPGYPKTVTLEGGESAELFAPLGATCTVEETGTGGATTVTIDPADGLTLDSEDGEFTFTVTNTFDAGSFKILKEVEGAGASFTEGEYVFDVSCTFDGSEEPVFTDTITLTGRGSTLESEEITGLPVGAVCTITETATGGADETPAPVQIVIDGDPQTVQIAGFVNRFSAGTIELTKRLAGDAAEDAFVKDLGFELTVTCQVEVDGARVDVYGGVVEVKAGEVVAPEVNGEPVLLPLGTRCFAVETGTQGATSAVVDRDSYENAAIVEKGTTDDPQTITLTATNTFDEAELTVSKRVEGPGKRGAKYRFELACTYPVDGVDVAYPLDPADAAFTLRHGESRTITVLAGVTCKVTETDAPGGAKVTYVDSDDSTAGGAADGVVADVRGTGNTVTVINAFEKLGVTGGAPLTGALVAALGLLVAGAALLAVRRRKGHTLSE